MQINVNKKFVAAGVAVILTMVVIISATVTIPNTFTSGDVISASKMNDNFNALKGVFNTTTGYLPYDDGTKLSNSGLYWDNTNGRLGVGTTSPGTLLHLSSAGTIMTMSSTGNGAANYTIYNGKQSNGTAQSYIIGQNGITGNGEWGVYDPTNSATRFVILPNGNVGIGTTAPGYKLAVECTVSGEYISQFVNKSSTGNGFSIAAGSSGSNNALWVTNYNGTIPLFYINGEGSGYLKATGWTYGSDRRIKEKISYFTDGLDVVQQLKPSKFDYISGAKNQYGFIAQDVQKVIPDAVVVTDVKTGILGLKTEFITPYLVNAIKELKSQKDSEIATLKQENENFKKENEELKARLKKIEEKLGIK
ncbi:MAG TPA: tail fiber domain-containing protein [Spirochaetota bacterium]|nr:tail fiber domain-containing protein [Spirochaetota bacterium]